MGRPDLAELITIEWSGGINGLPLDREEVEVLFEEAGLAEFTCDVFKRRLEARNGSLSAEEWSSRSRILGMLAQKGLLGRKFLVDGQWIGVGPGKVEELPGRKVKFYVAFR
ncbi:MAG: hypothetical protein GSR83_00395 [Desulfurococcales archaeon]|nr:hypothetical protein [Desulfurococcales archaeon]